MLLTLTDGFGTLPSWEEPRPDDILVRQSTIGSMQLCPGRTGLSQEPGFNNTPSEAMFFGSVVHAMIDRFLTLGDEGAWPFQLTTWEAIHETMLTEAIDDGFVLSEVATTEQIVLFVDEVRSSCQAWYSQVWQEWFHEINVVGSEVKLTRPLGVLADGRAVWLQGTPDIHTGADLYDWKTSGSKWSINGDGLTKGSFQPQAPLYLHLMGLTEGHFTFVVYDRKEGTWTTHTTEWSASSVASAVRNAWEVGKQIGAKAFPYLPFESSFGKYKRGWHCSPKYCGAWDICPGKDMISDGIDTSVKIDRRW